MSAAIYHRDASILNKYAFSRFDDFIRFVTNRTFRQIATQIGRDNIINPWVGEQEYVGSLLHVLRELADNFHLGGRIISGRSLRNTNFRDSIPLDENHKYPEVSGNFDDDDLFLSFINGLWPEPSSLNPMLEVLQDIIAKHFPNKRIDSFETDDGPVVAIRNNGASPFLISDLAYLNSQVSDEEIDDILNRSDDILASNGKGIHKVAGVSNKLVSFDYDGTTVLAHIDPTTGDYQYDENGEPVSILNPDAARLMKLYKTKGYEVVIVTARNPKMVKSIWKTIHKNSLPVSKVYATNHHPKSPTIRSIGATIHYDDNPFYVEEINESLAMRARAYYNTDMEKHLNKMQESENELV
jgi:hypothetical protein